MVAAGIIIALIMVFDTVLTVRLLRWVAAHQDDWSARGMRFPDYVPPEWLEEDRRRSPPA